MICNAEATTKPSIVRCAIYTRKSTEEGLEQDFNSLDAQRETIEAYVSSQKSAGWVCLPDRYDDGGFTGGNMERPALRRLLADIEAGKIDCVAVYKVDRMSRSLLDFTRMMEAFEKHGVSFVSVTQHFNTATPMGRLILHVLLSFAQFEREINSERTRDKIASARRKGRWSGGTPVLGFDIVRSPGGSRLVVNAEEAKRVRYIFDQYAECRSITRIIRRLDELGWRTKAWKTRQGRKRGGRLFEKGTIYKMLTNALYIGKVRYKDQVYEGEHDAIVDEALFRRVGEQLRSNGRTGGGQTRNKYGALLKGLVQCKACGCGMGHHFSAKRAKRYRYYVCTKAQKRGRATCPSPSLPAGELEQFVVNEIRSLGTDGAVIRDVVQRRQQEYRDDIERLTNDRRKLRERVTYLNTRIRDVAKQPDNGTSLDDLQDRLRDAEQDVARTDNELIAARQRIVDEDELVGGVEAFDPVWEQLKPSEQARLIHLLVRQVEYDANSESVAITFHPTGIRALTAQEVTA